MKMTSKMNKNEKSEIMRRSHLETSKMNKNEKSEIVKGRPRRHHEDF